MLNPMIDANINRNVADVINYIKATEFAVKRLSSLPLCNRLIKETHEVLMADVRGRKRVPEIFAHLKNGLAVKAVR